MISPNHSGLKHPTTVEEGGHEAMPKGRRNSCRGSCKWSDFNHHHHHHHPSSIPPPGDEGSFLPPTPITTPPPL
ncbi:hypothetical protein PGT21_026476 [Puccinia graminis f. sp. tritici]|uniref:Uncharacterized protein n=1 Tax=Puccinia graminis f. sp. tritici TaxID=56615 RepID=A0A5B0N6L6_PUCGR|nr:hypothetical protein PGT21_026476 [Puccinia graminis f. sp. tritici]